MLPKGGPRRGRHRSTGEMPVSPIGYEDLGSSRRRSVPSTTTMRKTSRKVEQSSLASHHGSGLGEQRKPRDFAENLRRKNQRKRVLTGIGAIAVVLIVALLAAFFTFRSTVGSSMVLKDSDALGALTVPKSGEPYYVLISAELGSIAKPLENTGPDSFLLARVDNGANSLALVNIPANLQVSNNGRPASLDSLSANGDAALIEAVSTFAGVPIAHYVKIDDQGIKEMVDKLGGLNMDISQVIDDPRAGAIYLPEGPYVMNGEAALIFLRAENLKLGFKDKMENQLSFASSLLYKLLGEPSFASKIDAVDECFQTDMALSDMEVIAGWLQNKGQKSVVTALIPGYLTPSTGVNNSGEERYIANSDSVKELMKLLEKGETPSYQAMDGIALLNPQELSVDIQNGTTITGAASVTAELLRSKGFNIGSIGNAEQQVYSETLVIYKGSEKLADAKTVMNALGVGRPVDASVYYSFPSDVLVIIGNDYSPVS